MCGRFSLAVLLEEIIAEFYGLEVNFGYHPRYNIAPSQQIMVILDALNPKFTTIRWGLIPSWAKDSTVGNKLINARSESVDQKPSFRDSWKRRRCLIPADGFYEWKRRGRRGVPHHIRMKSGKTFAFAGIWDQWRAPDDRLITTCSILTTEPNDLIKPIHDRMPVILPKSGWVDWVQTPEEHVESLKPLLRPFPAKEMEAIAVSDLVNKPENDRPECLAPAPFQLSF